MSNKHSDLGVRMKAYESVSTSPMLLPRVPILARIDGKAFHTFCRGMARPYDARLSALMADTTRWLVEETNATCGYTQSDEISLVWKVEGPQSEPIFNGKISKLTSVLASMTTAKFNALRVEREIFAEKPLAFFDTRVWNIPTDEEVANYFIWREQDAVRNSVSMAAQAYYSPKQLHGKHSGEMHEMLHQKGVNWNDYPEFFKRGVYLQRREVIRKFSTEEVEKLPAQHEARTNPELMVTRHDVMELKIDVLTRVANRIDVLLYGAAPIGVQNEEHKNP